MPAKTRCPWPGEDPLYVAYHDEEWGVPETDSRALWEKLILDGFQAGLSWITILRKRENFRKAFHNFDPARIARYGEKDIGRLLADEGIIRHRGKIEASINNAQRALELKKEAGSLAAYFWRHEPPASERPKRYDWGTLSKIGQSPTSLALSKDLKKRGWRFVGPTTMYALMQAMGEAVERLNGRYIIAEDVGTAVQDMVQINQKTSHVVGLPPTGGVVGSGDPSPATAWGVYLGIQAAVRHQMQRNDLEGMKVLVQGIGHVGYYLCKHLFDAGAELIVSDIQADNVARAVNEFNATAVAPQDIFKQQADIYAPCALGATINDTTLPQLQFRIVAGSANNQLAEERHGQLLAQKGILYAPDYVINAGGLINVYYEHAGRVDGKGYDQPRAYAHIETIYETLSSIFERSARDGTATNIAANRLAEERFHPRRGNIRLAA